MTASSMISRSAANRGTLASSPASVPAAAWLAVARRRVYFGHQSVGNDIVAGVDALNEEHDLGLRFVQTTSPAAVAGPAFVHFLAGQNAMPASKNAALLRELAARPIADHAIALVKYCYVDITEQTDVRRVFEEYLDLAREVRARHPDLTLLHCTVPVTEVESEARAAIKRALGRPTLRGASVKRQRYNDLIRAEFGGRGILFDVAAIEAMDARTGFSSAGHRIQTIDPAMTHDGGHLNAVGRRVVAGALLDLLGAVALRLEAHA